MRTLQFPRSAQFWVAALLLGTAPLALSGCGGSDDGSANGGGGSSGTQLTGKTAIQAPIIAGYQAFIGGINYPFHQVQSTLPNTSPFKSALKAALKLRSGSHLQPSVINGPDGLGLYEIDTTTSTTDTVTFYSDAAATKSVGTLTIGYAAGTTLGTYSAYPVNFTINANLTSGPLPFTGSGTITLLDSNGKGEIKGSFNLPASKVSGSADLFLSDTGNVTGTATVMENGQTLTLTNINGLISGNITGNVAVAPQGYTGTATLSIVNGTFMVVLNTPSGTATGTNTSATNLNITLGGTTTSFSGALTASPTSTGTTGGGGTGGGTGGSYTVTDLGVLSGDTDSAPTAIDSKGDVVGYSSQVTGHQDAFLFSGGKLTALTTLPGATSSEALGMNDKGQIVGYVTTAATGYHGFVSTNGRATDLGGQYCFARAINNSGVIVGTAIASSQTAHAVVFNSNGSLTDLGSLGGLYSDANAINASGQIVGDADLPSGTASDPALFKIGSTTPTDLGNLGGGAGSANAINASGVIVGESVTVANGPQAFVYTGGKITSLGSLPGGGNSEALAINTSGVIVGDAYPAASSQHAVIFKIGSTTPTDLNSLLSSADQAKYLLSVATGINDSGQICAYGFVGQNTHAFLLTPKP